MSKTVVEIKNSKNKIEADILKTLKDFEKSSELRIRRVEVSIDHISWEEEEKLRKNPKNKPRSLKGVLDVIIHCDLDNDPRSVD